MASPVLLCAVNSCLMPVCLVAGREVVSVEGVGCSAKMHPVQRTMAASGGSQCGYCTPGFICSMFEGYYRDDLRTHEDLDEQLSGNLCRCTGYRPIREAAVRSLFRTRSSKTARMTASPNNCLKKSRSHPIRRRLRGVR